VQDVRWIENIYRVDVSPSAESEPHFWAKKLVLAIGSPPNVAFESARSDALEQGICYIDNMYEPSLDFNPHSALQLLRHVLVTKTRQFSDTTNRNSLTAATLN